MSFLSLIRHWSVWREIILCFTWILIIIYWLMSVLCLHWIKKYCFHPSFVIHSKIVGFHHFNLHLTYLNKNILRSTDIWDEIISMQLKINIELLALHWLQLVQCSVLPNQTCCNFDFVDRKIKSNCKDVL